MKNNDNPKTLGILSIVFSSVSLFIFGFLSIAGLILGVGGLIKAKKDGESGSAVVLNVVGTIISAIAVVLYIMTLFMLNSNAAA